MDVVGCEAKQIDYDKVCNSIYKTGTAGKCEILRGEEMKEEKKYLWKIVNGKLESADDCNVHYNEYGLPVHIEDYGQGSCHYSLISTEDEKDIRQGIDDTIWAVSRLKWATKNNSSERAELLRVIVRGKR